LAPCNCAGGTAFNDIWYVGQFLFGAHLLLIGYLAYRSGYVPRIVGALLLIAGLGYATDSLGAVLSADSWNAVSSFTFLREFLLALWLVIRARHISVGAAEPKLSKAPHDRLLAQARTPLSRDERHDESDPRPARAATCQGHAAARSAAFAGSVVDAHRKPHRRDCTSPHGCCRDLRQRRGGQRSRDPDPESMPRAATRSSTDRVETPQA
jgi:hypothetical protein